jgi:hypothetical protein
MNEFDLASLACIKESNLSIAKNLIDIKYLLTQILDNLERKQVKQDSCSTKRRIY